MIFLAGYKMRENGTRRILCPTGAYKWVKDKRPQVRRFAAAYLKKKCWYCEGELVPVGSSRSNGADHDDWNTRYLHKQCWRWLKKGQERFSDHQEEQEEMGMILSSEDDEDDGEEEEDCENDGEEEDFSEENLLQ